MKDINVTYLPGDIMPQYRGDRVLFIVSHEKEDPTFEEILLSEVLEGKLGHDDSIRTYLGVNGEAKKQVEGRYISGDFRHAFDLDAQIIIDERAELKCEQVSSLLRRVRNNVTDFMMQ